MTTTPGAFIAVTDLRAAIEGTALEVRGGTTRRLDGFEQVIAANRRFSSPSGAPAGDPYETYVDLTYESDADIWDLLDGDLHLRSRDQLRRIRVWAEGAAADFPFEAAADPARGALALAPHLSLVRAVPSPSVRPAQPPSHLVVASAMYPDAPGMPSLDLADDRLAVHTAVGQAQGVLGAGRLSLEDFRGTEIDHVGRALRLIGQPTALVLCGHARPGALGLGDRWVPADELIDALHGIDLRLVVLASCSSATGGVESTASRLAAAGVPLVVGMNDLAEQRLARHFTQSLLSTLLEGNTIDEAVQAGRQRIVDHVQLRQHATPVLITAVADIHEEVPVASAVLSPAPPAARVQPVAEPLGATAPAATEPAGAPGTAELPRRFPRHRFGAYLARTRLVETIEQRLEGDDLVVLGGRRGSGKTHLARTVCERSTADLVWWINAESEDSVVRQLAALARHLGIGPAAGRPEDIEPSTDEARSAAEACIDWLERSRDRWLLVLDNLDDPVRLDRWLPRGRRGSGSVVTMIDPDSQTGLNGHVVPVGPLAHDEAIEMLQLVTGLSDRTGMDDLVDLLDRLPLAIYQAGSYINEHFVSVADYDRRLRADIATIGAGVADAVCRIGLAELDPVQTAFFGTLCYLDIDSVPQQLVRSPATEQALGMTSAEIDRAIRKLRRSGLIEVDREVGALRIHRLTARIALARDGR